MILLKLIFFLFLLGLVAALFAVATVWRSVRGLLGLFRGGQARPESRGGASDEARVHRAARPKGKKIFSPDEGEYVDFTEE